MCVRGVGAELKVIKIYGWQLIAALTLIAGLLVSRGGFAALQPILKFMAPFVLLWLLWRLLRRKLVALAGGAMRQRLDTMMQQMQQQQAARSNGQGVIDLCPRCGSYLSVGHRCHTKA